MQQLCLYIYTTAKGADAPVKSITLSDGLLAKSINHPKELIGHIHDLSEGNEDTEIVCNSVDINIKLLKRFHVFSGVGRYKLVGVLDEAYKSYRQGILPMPNSLNGVRLHGLHQVEEALRQRGYEIPKGISFNRPNIHVKHLLDVLAVIRTNEEEASASITAKVG